MKKKIIIATAALGLLGAMIAPQANAASKTIKKTAAKTHVAAKTTKAKKKTTGKKKKVARITHSLRPIAINSPDAPLITQ